MHIYFCSHCIILLCIVCSCVVCIDVSTNNHLVSYCYTSYKDVCVHAARRILAYTIAVVIVQQFMHTTIVNDTDTKSTVN